MGTSSSAVDLSRKFDKLSREIDARQKQASRNGAAVIEREVRQKMRAATGGDLVLSGLGQSKGGKSRGKLGVKTAPARAVPDATIVFATGPAHLAENDVDKHYVVSKYAKGAQRISQTTGRKLRATRQSRIASVAFGQGAAGGGRRAVLHWGGNNYARFVVASSKGRHPWRNGVKASQQKAVVAMRKHEVGALTKVFG